jgi:hypothetical protein
MNLNLLERWIRLGIGAILIALYVWGPKTPWGLIGLIFIASGITGFCPVWKILGISTLKKAPPVPKTSYQPTDENTNQKDEL